MKTLLDLLGYSVTAAAGGEEVERLPDTPPYHLMLADVVLPGPSGLEVARAAQVRWPGMKIILMSGYAQDAATRKSVESGSIPFLHKPFGLHDLAVRVSDALALRGSQGAH